MIFTSHASAEFWELYAALPEAIQQQADKQYALWCPGPIALWRFGVAIRLYWFWIGPHDEYERLTTG